MERGEPSGGAGRRNERARADSAQGNRGFTYVKQTNALTNAMKKPLRALSTPAMRAANAPNHSVSATSARTTVGHAMSGRGGTFFASRRGLRAAGERSLSCSSSPVLNCERKQMMWPSGRLNAAQKSIASRCPARPNAADNTAARRQASIYMSWRHMSDVNRCQEVSTTSQFG